jgi:hypothetical protein
MSWRANLGAICAVAAVSLAGPITAQPAPNLQWTPTAKIVAQLEKAIPPQEGFRRPKDLNLSDYDRYYTGSQVDGRKVILGLYVQIRTRDSAQRPDSARTGQIHIAPSQQLPLISDGGCGVIHVFYDPQTGSPPTLQCNGYG